MHNQRILLIGLGSHYGGVETYLEGLAGILCPRARVYAVCSLPKHAAKLRAQGVTVFCLPLLGSKWLKALRLVAACLVVPYVLLRFRVRVVQINGYFESLLLGPLRLLGCRTIYTMHGPFETELYSWFTNPARFFPRFFSRHSLCFASLVVCVSEAVGKIARTVLPAEQVRVIANWVQLPPYPRSVFSIEAKPQLLFVGRLEQYKGVQFIFEAMRQLSGISLLVVGEGKYRTCLEATADGLDVRFTGFQSDPSRFYRDAAIFVNPSLGPEGLPMVSLEAMAHGVPCIFSDLPVHREISGQGLAAALFKAGDSQDLVTQLQLLLSDERRRASCGHSARQRVEKNYCLASAAPQYIEAFGLVQSGSAWNGCAAAEESV